MNKNETTSNLAIGSENIVLGKCPDCGGDVIDKGKIYGCTNFPDCRFSIFKEILGKKISMTIVRQLLGAGHTPERMELKKTDQVTGKIDIFYAHLAIKETLSGYRVYAEKYLSLGTCPKCRNGQITEREKVYKCNEKKCGAYAFKNYFEVELKPNQIKKLLVSPFRISVDKKTKAGVTRKVYLEFKDLFK